MLIGLRYKIFRYIFITVVATIVTACAGNDIDDEPTMAGDDQIRITADISHVGQTRAYQAEGQVRDGMYNLTFPTVVENQYNVGEVRFGVSVENPQVGFVTLPGNLPLKWLKVGGGSTPTLYLDNISRAIPDATSQTTVTFNGTNNPYVAAPFDSIDGTNDLLWGAKMFQRNAGTLQFDLQHAMARVRLMVTADNSNGVIDLSDATVKITNINQSPLSFNRLEGVLNLSEEPEAYTELVMVEPEDADRRWIIQYSLNDNKKVYHSCDFVLPPQELLQDQNRPRLVITLANGTEFSGILPSAMLISDGTHPEPSYPVALSFLSQYVLTIRTVVTDDPPTLSFMPVYVMKWVDKGTFDEEAHQSGIYTAEEFYKLIDYYNRGNVFQLDRYGKQKEENGVKVWYFDFWHGVTLDYNEIKGMMKPNPQAGPFTFNFNNYSISVKYDDSDEGTQTVSPSTLYNIVTSN